jgi:OmpA-OmpF porin, OOP family
MTRKFITVAMIALLGADIASAAEADVKGGQDYPGIGRFADSVITGYEVKDFDETKLQTAVFKDGKSAGQQKIEGRVTRIAYRTAEGPSIAEVFRNFENQVTGGGYETLLKCETDECGGIPFSETLDMLTVPMMWVDGFNYRYLSAQKDKTFLEVVVSENNGRVFAELNVIETAGLENKMVNAAEMAKGLGDTGHIALYGIYFDTDKADIKPESRPTLDEIAKLLREQPELKVYIVGHTDSQGGYDYNLELSRRRAQAVALDLAKTYRVERARLSSAGVGFLAPIGSNASEAGRALNRRVELVQP